jgi:hypothetical protein
VVEVIVNNMDKSLKIFFPNYVQEYPLWMKPGPQLRLEKYSLLCGSADEKKSGTNNTSKEVATIQPSKTGEKISIWGGGCHKQYSHTAHMTSTIASQ